MAYNYLGIAYNEKGEIEKALDMFERSIRFDPGYSEPYYNVGLIYAKLGRLKEARDRLSKGIELGLEKEKEEKARRELGRIP